MAITFMYHNFCRKHMTIKTTLAISLGIDNQEWSVEEMVDLLPLLSYNTRPKN